MASPTIKKTIFKYSDSLADKICTFAARGENISIIATHPNMPTTRLIQKWLMKYPDFLKKWQEARFIAADHLSSEIVQIADEATPETLNLAKLRIDARKWLAGRFSTESVIKEKNIPPPVLQRIETVLIDPRKETDQEK